MSSKLVKSDSGFIKAMCIAVSKWQGTDVPHARIIRIHGEDDLIIKCPDDCIKTPGAGHLVAMTHAKECVDALRRGFV